MGSRRLSEPGKFHDMLAEAFTAPEGGRATACLILDRDKTTLSNWTDPRAAHGQRIYGEDLDHLAREDDRAADVIARHFAALAGKRLVGCAGAEGSLSGIAAASAQLGSRVAGVVLGATDPHGPGGIDWTPSELRQLLEVADEMANAAAKLRAHVMRVSA